MLLVVKSLAITVLSLKGSTEMSTETPGYRTHFAQYLKHPDWGRASWIKEDKVIALREVY